MALNGTASVRVRVVPFDACGNPEPQALRDTLAERTDRRFREMIGNGALEEARSLLGIAPDLPAARALGVPQLWQHLRGEASLDAAIEATQLATRQYAKRQLTWLRSTNPRTVVAADAPDAMAQALAALERALEGAPADGR